VGPKALPTPLGLVVLADEQVVDGREPFAALLAFHPVLPASSAYVTYRSRGSRLVRPYPGEPFRNANGGVAEHIWPDLARK
jgi:hypothetical protein